MKYKYGLLALASVIIFALLLKQTPGQPTEEALILHQVVQEFYNIRDVRFPRGACTQTAEELYYDFASQPIEITGGYAIEGAETLTFGNDKNIGIIEMDRAMINMHTETVVRGLRTTLYNMVLYGTSAENFIVNEGRFETQTLDCQFISIQGIAQCDCQTRR
ncbi:MAG TPA: hypothetical protein VI612_01025 [Candidatus Nanoarchaeia archaeon]|nr:hypothetical protein [Candidatus Nanoarchaeia archaeon]